ncbi:calreticulin [Leguminivora glycinivorella]|uniref:calreticulin n=1 Tax=Leguminivora glycinivorella TaxID=1035111 RepID=UPI00200D6A08|nr:calreticulin [Leguminivora glycinivorella]
MKSLVLAFVSFLAIYSVNCEVYYEETFPDDKWESEWIYSEHPGKEFGKFKLTAGKFYNDAEADKGLQTSEDARFYALSKKFKPFSNKDKPLVVQFSVKHEQDIDCGGGYLKVFDCKLDQKDMHGESPYEIMFGPDICGPGTKKVHVIFSYKGKNHLIKKDIRCKDDVYTHLYTLIVKPDNTYEVLIDNEKVESGDLEADWDFLPPKKIKDPEAKKPEDWDDRATIPDPEDKKPDDWEKPEHIPDPDAAKPDDWDDEMDGEWEPPMIDNPEYKGVWAPKQIDNPAYKGPWIHPEIDNPEYTPDPLLYKRDELCSVGLDLWQVKSGTIFDNILFTDDVEIAKERGEAIKKTQEGEKKMKTEQDEAEREKEKAERPDDEEDDEDLDDEAGDAAPVEEHDEL